MATLLPTNLYGESGARFIGTGGMTELEMTTEAEVEDFTDELSDEALDRAEGASYTSSQMTLAGF